MLKKRPNNLIAPIVIAGITAGFFISAYRFVFAKLKTEPEEKSQQAPADFAENSDEE